MEVRKRMIGFALLACLSSACASQATPADTVAPMVAAEQSQFSDPFMYCAAIGTIDAPDEQYVGPAAHEAVITQVREKAGIADDAPADWVAAGTIWRCMDSKVRACFVGANLPCSERAETSVTPQPALNDFCQANPNVDIIPQTVTGRATIYDWHCVAGTPQVGEQRFTPDAQGFLSEFWYELGSE